MRRRKNAIHSLDLGGRVTSVEGKIRNHILKYYRDIFGKQPQFRLSLVAESWNKFTDLSSLELDFSDDEIKRAVWDLERNKALGLDGFPIFFF